MWRFTSIYIDTADLGLHVEITLQDVPNLKYTLRLLMQNEEREIQRKTRQTWVPAQRLYVSSFLTEYTTRSSREYRDISPTSHMRVEIEMRSSHLPFAKKEQAIKEINLQELFNHYWTSKAHDLPVRG